MQKQIGNTPFYTNTIYEADDNGREFKIVRLEDNQDNVKYNVTIELDGGETRGGTISYTGNNNGKDVYKLTARGIYKTKYENNGSYSKYRKMARRNHKSRKMARKNRKSRNTRRNRRNYSLRI